MSYLMPSTNVRCTWHLSPVPWCQSCQMSTSDMIDVNYYLYYLILFYITYWSVSLAYSCHEGRLVVDQPSLVLWSCPWLLTWLRRGFTYDFVSLSVPACCLACPLFPSHDVLYVHAPMSVPVRYYTWVVCYVRCGKSHVPSADGPPLITASIRRLITYQVIILTLYNQPEWC
jgi:hypothetical protein